MSYGRSWPDESDIGQVRVNEPSLTECPRRNFRRSVHASLNDFTLRCPMRPTLSIHGYLTILVIAVILPFLGFTTLVVDHAGRGEQELRARMVREAAIGTAGDLDRQLGTLQALVLALAELTGATDRRPRSVPQPGRRTAAPAGRDRRALRSDRPRTREHRGAVRDTAAGRTGCRDAGGEEWPRRGVRSHHGSADRAADGGYRGSRHARRRSCLCAEPTNCARYCLGDDGAVDPTGTNHWADRSHRNDRLSHTRSATGRRR